MKQKDRLSQILVITFMGITALLILVPFLILLSVSLSDEKDILLSGYSLFPKNFTLSAYSYILKNPVAIINAYKVTIFYSVVGTILSTFLMALLAYPLTKRNLKGRNVISFIIYFTMLFGGGLVPTYILLTRYLKLGDTIWIYILPSMISPWYVFMMRTFFKDLPGEIMESALIDGANEYIIFIKMIIPLSKPVLATVALFTFLSKWNDWFTSMLYIDNQDLLSLQYLLQRIMQNIELLQNNKYSAIISVKDIPSETVRMAMAVVVAGPALLVFPFFQKYFVKGLTVGSVKG